MIRFGSRLYFAILLVITVLAPLNPGASGDEIPKFIDQRKESGLYIGNPLGHVAVWGDYNGDGWQDVILSSMSLRGWAKPRGNKKTRSALDKPEAKRNQNFLLFANADGKSFSETSEMAGLPDLKGKSASWADYDNDGYLDLAVTTIAAGKPPVLFRNSNKFTFTDVSRKAGLTIEGANPNQVLWVDFDNDGLVDLFQAGTGGSILYRNQGDGTFKDVSGPAGLGAKTKTNGAVWFDSNNDGHQDLFLTNTGYNSFYMNVGDGTFTDYTEKAGLPGELSWKTSSACAGDYNGDGFIDLYITNIGRSIRNALYRNNGDGTFTDVTAETGTADAGDGRTCAWTDVDADGRLDLFTTNHIRPNRLYRNTGKGSFMDAAPKAGLDSPIDVFSATWADYDRDGYIDVLLNGHAGLVLMKNNGNSNNSITLKLEGDGEKTNRSAIGARVEVRSPAGVQIREVSGGRGCCEQDMLPLYFGLGTAEAADIDVRWPSGKVCSFKGIAVDKVNEYKISEIKCVIDPSS